MRKIFVQFMKEAKDKRGFYYWVTIVPLTCASVTYVTLMNYRYGIFTNIAGAVSAALLISGVLILTMFGIFWIKMIRTDGRKNMYGDLLYLLNDGFSMIHGLRKGEKPSEHHTLYALSNICDQLKKHFDRKTKSTCCVSIKVLQQVEADGSIDERASLLNLCRDSTGVKLRDSADYERLHHGVFNNTPFRTIAEKLRTTGETEFYYINNNIDKDKQYQNSSRPLYKEGLLPYKSELVVPLRPLSNKLHDRKVIGYLCVDSNRKPKFGTRYDLEIMKGAADGVYDVILDHVIIQEENKKE